MKTLFIILLVIVLVPVAFFVFALIANIYLLATGKMTKEGLASKAETYNAEKRKKKQEKKRSSSILIDSDSDVAWSLGEDTLF